MDLSEFPFISFDFDTRSLDAPMWLDLGEAMSKCQHLAGVPLKPAVAHRMASVYLAKGVKATTAIEGNTLTAEEVNQIVKNGSAEVGASRAYLEREVQNVLTAIREIDDALRAGDSLPITRERLEYLNFKILDGIPESDEVVPGEVRTHNVGAGSYRAPDWQDVPELLDKFVKWMSELREWSQKDASAQQKFVGAMLAAILAHLYIAWIHPFGNGNGRLARLIEVQILSESGVVPIVATNLLSDFYNKTRDNYYLALNAAQRDVNQFIRYAMRGFLDEIRTQIDSVRAENLQIHWESYVHGAFKNQPSTDSRTRQRELALALPYDVWSTARESTELTTSLAKKYAVMGDRAPARDLNELAKMEIVAKQGKRYRARREIIEAFIPPTSETALADPPKFLAELPPESDPTLFDEV